MENWDIKIINVKYIKIYYITPLKLNIYIREI